MNNPNNNNVNNVTSIHPNNSSTNNTNSYHLNSSNSANPMNPNYLSHSSNTGHPAMNNQSAFHMNNANSNMMSHSANSSQMVTNGQVEQFPYALTPQQIENLQNLIRQFKALGKRFAESKIPKLIEAQVQSLVPQTSTDSAKSSSAPETSHNPPSVAQIAPQVPPAVHQHSYMSQTGPHSTPLGTQPPVHLSSSLNAHHPIEKPVPQVVSKQIPVPTHAERSSVTKDPHHPPQTSHHPTGIAPTSSAPTTSQAPLPSSSSSNNLVQSSTTSQVTTNLPSLSLSWQCFHSLLLFGTSKNMGENAISFPPSDVGCFSKGAYLPLVLTIPGITSIREELVKSSLILNSSQKKSDASGQNRLMTQCFYLQRHVRGNILKTLMEVRSKELAEDPGWQPFKLTAGIALGTANYFADLIPSSSCYRVRKQSKREIKIYEKEDKKKRIEIDEKRKKKISDYHKALMDHRDAFQKFHKNCRNEASRVAKLVKGWVDNQDSKRERDEARSELKRLQALKENDMEAYMALLQDTKNGRLKFLLNETDNYIATINRMIQEQRSPDEKEDGSENQQKASLADLVSTKSTETAKNYYSSTHRKIEIVQQPRMLKGGDLKEYQLSGLQWLVSLYNNNLNGILADEMGLGKTIQTIALLSYLMEFKHNNGPFLIVVPLSTLSNWVNEFNKWAPDIIKVVYKGTPDDRKRIFKEEIESHLLNVLITTYEYIMKDKASLRKLTWQYIIVDEGHRMKNAQSKFAQTLGNVYQSKHRILLTGTPLQNSLPELWALLNFLLPTIFSSVDTFDQWFNKPFAQFRNQAAANAATGAEESGGEANTLTQEERMLIVHRLHEVLRPFVLRRVKDQVLDQLPEKVEKILRCSLSGWQRKMYHSITVRTLANKAKESIGGGLNNTIMQLRKVCNHPYLFIRDYIIDEDMIRISGKFELLDRMLPKLKAAGHRILIFSQMVEVMNFLEQFFNYRGFYFLRLDGNTTADEREKRMYMFNDPNSPYFIFLLSTKAGGLGLNLATADTVIIFDSDWNPMVDAQAQDRAHRIGQKNEVRVFRLLTNSAIEEKILARATDKLNLTGLVVEAGKFNSNKTTEEGEMDNKEMMESLLREWSSGGAEMSGYGNAEQYENTDFDDRVDDDIPDDDQINEMMAAYDGEYELYQKMDQDLAEREGLNRPPRLMKATERPPWLTAECWPTKYSVLMTDMMTTQPLRTLSSTGGQTGPKKKGRKRKNADESLLAVQQLVDDGDGRDSPSVVDWNDTSQFLDDSYSDANIVAGKVMRKRKEVKYDDGMTEFQFKKFLERQAVAEESQQHEQKGKRGKRGTAHLNSLFQGIMKIIQEIQKIKKTDGTVLAELFLEKPSKVYYPDYYQIIESPISLKEILSKLRNEEYRHFEEIENDFALMSHNARLYNGDLSPVFQTSESIRREFYLRTMDIRQQFNISSLSDPITRFGNGASSANGKNSSQQEIPPLPLATYQIFPKGKSYVGELIMQETKPRKKAKLSGSASKDTLNLSFNGGGDVEGDDNYGNDDYGEDYDNQSQSNSVGGGGLVLNFGGIKPKSKR